MPMSRRAASALVGAASLLGAAVSFPGLAHAQESFAFRRFSGNDRYDTARLVASDTFGTAKVVVLASGESFADAMAGGYLAGVGTAPILLTQRAALPQGTAVALQALKTTSVLIVGGEAAVSTALEKDLQARGYATSRIAGANRYATAQKIAESGTVAAVGSLDGAKTAILASGENYPDALSVGGMSFARRFPTLLTPRASLAPETRAALQNLAIKRLLVVGGTGAVSAAVANAVADMGIAVTRLAGADRGDTSANVADFEVTKLGFSTATVDLASGSRFADALALGPHAGRTASPVLLSLNTNDLGAATHNWLSSHAATLANGRIAGGTSALSAAAESDATNDARSATTSTSSTSTSTTIAGATSTTSTTSTTAAPTTTTTVVPQGQPCPSNQGPGPQPFCFPNPPPSPTTTLPTPPTTPTTAPPPTTPTTAQGAPAFVPPATAVDQGLTLTAHYNQPIDCATVNPADYSVTITSGPGVPPPFSFTPGNATCSSPSATNESSTVLIGVPNDIAGAHFQQGQTGTLTMGGEIKTKTGTSQAKNDTTPLVVTPSSS